MTPATTPGGIRGPKWMTTRCAAIALTLAVLTDGAALGQTAVTVRANAPRSIGGVRSLDRARYFNHWGQQTPGANTNLGDLETAVHSPTDLHTFSGRETNDFLFAMQQQWNVFSPEDPNNPGFFDEAAVVSKLQNDTNTWGYKRRVLQGSQWDSLRDAENPIYVTSGRKGLYPDFIDGGTDLVTNYAGYADLINIYLREVVYGTGPGQGYLPFDKDRFYVEIMNEPQWANSPTPNWDDVVALHREVTQLVKEVHPQAKIGGLGCCGGLDVHPNNNWDRMQQVMDDMVGWQTPSGDSVEFDFWSLHVYERYDVASDGSWSQATHFSPGHLAATMDLYETYSNELFGDPKAFAITEYGSWNRTAITNGPGSADDDYGDYTRAEQQWDLVRDTREKLMVFMKRPDRIVNATPFLGPMWWENQTPTSPAGDNVFWERDAQGLWHETIVAGMYRMHNDLRGEYLDVSSDNPDLQALAFRDGAKVYVMLNNLENASNTVNLQAITGGATVSSASLDRVFWDGAQGVYEAGIDRTADWQSLTLAPDEGAVLTLTLAGTVLNDLVTDVQTYYGDDTLSSISSPSGQSGVINVSADIDDAVSARVRVGFHRDGAALGEGFVVDVNGTQVTVPAGELAYDDADTDMVSREIEVPVAALVDGVNQVSVDFAGAGGELITAVIEVTRSIGDFNGSGAFDAGDIAELIGEFGPASAGSRFDLTSDGVVDVADLEYWLSDLRGATFDLLGDFNADGAVDSADYTLWRMGFGLPDFIALSGNSDGFGTASATDYLIWRANFGATQQASGQSEQVSVPEPATWIGLLIGAATGVGRRPRQRVWRPGTQSQSQRGARLRFIGT